MREYISFISGIISIGALFVVAALGVINGVEPVTCSYRAVCGAVFVYCAVTISLRIVARIVLTALVENKSREDESLDEE